MERTEKNIKLLISQNPSKIKGFEDSGFRKHFPISSQPRYDHFDNSPCLSQHDFISPNRKNGSEKTENLGRKRGENEKNIKLLNTAKTRYI